MNSIDNLVKVETLFINKCSQQSHQPLDITDNYRLLHPTRAETHPSQVHTECSPRMITLWAMYNT